MLNFQLILGITILTQIGFGYSKVACKRNIFITEKASQDTCEKELNRITCGTLQEALLTVQLTDACLHIEKDSLLNTTIVIENVSNLNITSSNLSTVSCNGAALRFCQSTGIHFSNITFTDCGSELEIFWNGENVNISSALSFNQSDQISVTKCKFSSSLGYGLTFIDSNDVSISTVLVVKSTYKSVWYKDETFSTGGGMFIHFQDKDNNTFSIQDSQFMSTSINSENDVHFNSGNSDLPYGKGAGILFSCEKGRRNNVLSIESSIISYNSGNIGSGIYATFRSDTEKNSIIFQEGRIQFNKAKISGGGAYFCTSSNKTNFVIVNNSLLSDNEGTIGGAVSFVRTDTFSEYIQSGFLSMENVTMTRNNARVGSTAHFQNALINLNNVRIFNSSVQLKDNVPGKGAVYVLRSHLTFLGEGNVFYNNNNSALIADDSKVFINGTVQFLKNIGYNGGALAFYEHSRLVLQEISHMIFYQNHAWSQGGAMYILSPGPMVVPWKTTELNTYSCFIEFFNTTSKQFGGSLLFEDNQSEDGDSHDIFMSSLRSCHHADESYCDIFEKWNNFNFTNNIDGSTIATNAISIYPLIAEEWTQYAGRLLTPHIVLNDERKNHVSESISIVINPRDKVEVETNSAFVVSNEDSIKLQLRVLSSSLIDNFSISVKTTSHLFLEANISNLSFKRCPLGFQFDPDEGMCECDILNNGELNIGFCDLDNIYVFSNTWLDVDHQEAYTCPQGYCQQNKTDFRYFLFNQNRQCTETRDQSSRLCSKCLPNYSAVSGSHSCEHCPLDSNGWIYIVFILAGSLFVLIVLIMIADIDIMSYNLNICLYSYQVIYMFYNSEQTIDPFLSFIMSTVQVSPRNTVYPSVCLWYGMTALGKNSIGLVIPGLMILYMLILYFVCYFKKQNWMMRWYKTTSIIVVMCFSDLIRISFETLHFVTIGGKKYVYQYADEPYIGPKHLPHFVISLFILLIVFSVSIFLTLRIQCRYDTFEWLDRLRNKVGDHFKKGKKWFWLMYFIFRVLVYSCGIFLTNWVKTKMAVLSLICFAFVLIVALLQPFQSKSVNLMETFVLTTLAAISVIGAGMHFVFLDENQNGLIRANFPLPTNPNCQKVLN